MPTKKIRKELKEANPKEVSYAISENFFFGFSGAIIVPFIGAYNSDTVLTASISPNGSPETIFCPTSGNSKNIITIWYIIFTKSK